MTTKLKRKKKSLNVLCGVLGDVLDTNQKRKQFFIWGGSTFRQLKSKF